MNQIILGYCTVCKKFEFPKRNDDNYVPIGKYENGVTNLKQIKLNEKGIEPKEPIENVTRMLNYKRHFCCDFCGGSLSKSIKCCQFWETLCYCPLWFVFIITSGFLAGMGGVGYLTYVYINSTQIPLQSYTQPCNSSNLQCDGTKGLFCKLSSIGVYESSCNCPALGVANTCDCPSSHYWDG
jgi:hypothetical protein